MLSEQTKTQCPIVSGRKDLRARKTTSISTQLICSRFFVLDQEPEVGLPSQRVLQPVLEASV